MTTLRRVLAVMSLVILAATTVHAASVLATVDSSEPFLLKGKRVPVAGINHWPAFRGDQIATTNSSALVSFRDGSYVLLDKNTEILLADKGGRVSLKVMRGKLSYKLSDISTLAFDNVTRTARAGTLAIQNGTLSVLADTGFFVQLEQRAAASPGTYPIQINWGTPPPGVTTTAGPLPVSAYRGGQ